MYITQHCRTENLSIPITKEMQATPFFKGPEFGPLSSKDLISWIFDNQPYDKDEKVSDNAIVDNNPSTPHPPVPPPD